MAAADKTPELSGFTTLTGTPKQVGDKLKQLDAEQVIALTLERGSGPANQALADTFKSIAPLIQGILARRTRETLEAVLEALVPQMPPPQHALVEARMTAEARSAVLENGNWLTAAEIAKLAGFSTSNPSAQPNKWKKEGLIFAIRHLNADYFPSYALDPATGYRPVKTMAKLLNIFKGKKDDWNLAFWFASNNSFLGGKRPQDLLATKPERVLAAAADEVAGVLHG